MPWTGKPTPSVPATAAACGKRKRLNPVIWNKGEEVKVAARGTNIDSKKDNVVIHKFEFGETDKASTRYLHGRPAT